MNPVIICSGFRRCGVYPLNPDVINCNVSVANPEASLQQANIEELNNQGDISSPPQSNDATSSISFEKGTLLQ